MIRLLRSYFFWTYERGSLHYDVMVTLILLFLFAAPRFIDFRDKPTTNLPLRHSEVLVREGGNTGDRARFTYEIRVDDLNNPATDAEIRSSLLRSIRPISGEVQVESYRPVLDARGKVIAYDATVLR